MRIINIAIWAAVAFILGMWYQAATVGVPRRAKAKADLRVARFSAASCYGIVGQHWMDHHIDYPGSRAIVATAFDLSETYQQLLEREK